MVRITLRLDDDQHAALGKIKEAYRRSLNSEIQYAIDYYLKHAPEAKEVLEKEVVKKKK
jgi:predicted transcriptional regulator